MKKNTIYRVLFFTVIVLLAALLVYFALREALPELLALLRHGSPDDIVAYLEENSTFRGVLCTALLQMVQVWSVVISGTPIQIAAGMAYGILGGFAICHLASAVAHLLAMLAYRRMGKRLEKWLPVEGKKTKLDFLLKSDTPAYTVVLACLIPILPNGVIPVVAAKTSIKPWEYFLAIWGGSAPNIFLCCMLGSQILRGGLLVTVILAAVMLVVVLLLWKYQDKVLARLKQWFPKKGK